ncbi:hypothetical protein DEI95_06315 [Curtobacterium sp. MCBD17_008]|nr:hypothetical protein DEI95_06315 [Curtobacterium sp. MCBD17_008]
MPWRPTSAVLVSVAVLLSVIVAPGTATAATGITPGHTAAPSGGTIALGAGIDGANQNAQLAEKLPTTIAPSWRNAPPKCPQAGNVTATSISVSATSTIVAEQQYGCSSLSAYATATGKLQWRNQADWVGMATVTGGKVYVTQVDRNGSSRVTKTLSAQTGKVLWSHAIGGNPRRSVSVGSGVVSTLDRVASAATGKFLFKLSLGEESSPGVSIVTGGRVHYADSGEVRTTDPKGRLLWSTKYPAGVEGLYASGDRPDISAHGRMLYVSGSKTIVLGAKTGRIVRTLPVSDQAIAFDGNVGFFTSRSELTGFPRIASTVRAINLTTGRVLWTHALPIDGTTAFHAVAAPVVSNGLVWFTQRANTGSPTTVVALDEVTGAQRSETVDACTDGSSSDGNLVIAQHRMFVSTGCGVQTFLAAKRTPVTPTPGEVLTDPGFERGTDEWTAIGDGTINRVASPAHGGSRALSVVPASSAAGTIGIQRVVERNGVRFGGYWASCWVRPTTAGMSAAMRDIEWAPGSEPQELPKGWDIPELTVGVWTKIEWIGHISTDGNSSTLQVFTQQDPSTGGTLLIDDCSVTESRPAGW